MNDPAVKVGLALSILLGGFLAAVALRPESSAPRAEAPSFSELAALRSRRYSERHVTGIAGKSVHPAASSQAADPGTDRIPTVLAPLDNPPQVPAIAPKYPGDGAPNSTVWGMPLIAPREKQAPRGSRTHKIEDGDTLPALAARYLGSADRAIEIFQANRDILSDPQLLPIGGELKIPQ